MPDTQTISASKMLGKRITVVVHSTPCRVVLEETRPLTETTTGALYRMLRAPAGTIGILKADDGSLIAFDMHLDIRSGKISLEADGSEIDAAASTPTTEAKS